MPSDLACRLFTSCTSLSVINRSSLQSRQSQRSYSIETMSEADDNTMKENLLPPASPTRHGNTNDSTSPVQKNVMWDSTDPMRNPPPLPLSPQLFRSIKNSQNKVSTNPVVGKIQLTSMDTTDIEFQLQKLLESQGSMKGLLQSIDTSVKHTQLDLDSLNDRSSNNNSRLKDLLESVAASADPENRITHDKIHEIVSRSIDPVCQKLSGIGDLKSDILNKLVDLDKKPSEKHERVIQALTMIKEQISSVLLNQPSHSDIERISKSIEKLNTDDVESIVTNGQKEVKEMLGFIQQTLKTFDYTNISDSLKSNHEDLQSKFDLIQQHIEKSTSDATHVELLHQSFQDLSRSMRLQHETSTKALEDISKTVQQPEHIQALRHLFSSSFEQLKTDAELKLRSILEVQATRESRTMEENTSKLQSVLGEWEEKISSEKEVFANSISEVKSWAEENAKETMKIALQEREMELSVKNKEIAELRAKLAEVESKTAIEASIGDLREKHAKLEARFHYLNEAYLSRYDNLKTLNKEFEEMTDRITNLNIEKLKSIMTATTFSSINNEVHSPVKPSGARVLSTNSYLMNTNNRFMMSRKKKSYSMTPLEGRDDSDEETSTHTAITDSADNKEN